MSAMPSSERGSHKIFIGYAPGVGKTFAMLEEAQRRQARGSKIVIGKVDDGGREATLNLMRDFPNLNSLAVPEDHPHYVLVDDLAAIDNGVPRWQAVQTLLDAGIHVLSTVNVANLESLNDHVADIVGDRVAQTVPDQVLHDAEEVEVIDLPVRALLNRLERGDILPLNEVPAAKEGFFRIGNLNALRELALREAAGKVNEDLEEYRREKRIEKPWAAADRVLVLISPTRSSLRMIRRAWRMGQRMHAQVMAAYVEDGEPVSEAGKKILSDDFALAQRLGIETLKLSGELAPTIIQLAKERNVTQIVLGHPERTRIQHMMKPSILSELVRGLRTVDFVVVAPEHVG